MAVFKKDGAWYIDYYHNRRRVRKKTKATTKREAKNLLAQVQAGIPLRQMAPLNSQVSCVEVVNRYLIASKGTKSESTYCRAEGALKNFFRWCPVKHVLEVTGEIFQRYAAYRKKAGVKVRTINIELANLKTCFNWAAENRIIPENPLQRFRKLRGEESGPDRFLSEAEMRRLLQASSGTVYHDIFYTLLRTGMRKGELLHLRWKDVDFDTRLIRIGGHHDEHGERHTKTHRERHVPMDDELAQILARQPRMPGIVYVFPNKNGKVRINNLLREFKRHCKRAGIEGANLHTLRHTFASTLVMAGVDLPSVKQLLGHSTIEMTMRYAHLAEEHLREAIEKVKLPSYRDGPNIVVGPGFRRTGS